MSAIKIPVGHELVSRWFVLLGYPEGDSYVRVGDMEPVGFDHEISARAYAEEKAPGHGSRCVIVVKTVAIYQRSKGFVVKEAK